MVSFRAKVLLVAFLGLILSASVMQAFALLPIASLTSPPPSTFFKFDGIRQASNSTAGIRPDPQVAAGPSSIVEMANAMVEIFSKQGVSLKNSTFASFFNSPPSAVGPGPDPRVVYNAASQRWFASIGTSLGVRLAVSTSSDPTGTWSFYYFTVCNGDQPYIGVNDDKLVISATTSYPGTGSSAVCVINKQELLSGASTVDNATFTFNVSVIRPVISLSSTGAEYMVSTGVTPTNVTQLYVITGTPPKKTSIHLTSLAIAQITEGADYNNIEGYDSRVQDAAWFKGKLWYTLNDGCIPPHTVALQDCFRLTEISTNTSRILQDFDFGTANQQSWYPAVKIDGNGNLDVVYGNSTGVAVTGQGVNDPLGSLRQPAMIKLPGGGIPGTVNNGFSYGDYFGAGVDPTDPRVVWVAGEYIPTPTTQCPPGSKENCWGTFVGSMNIPSFTMSITPAVLSMTAPGPGGFGTSYANLTLNSFNFSGQVTLSNTPNYFTALAGPILAYSQNVTLTANQPLVVAVSVGICSSTPSRTFTITGSSTTTVVNITFTVNITGQKPGACPT